MTRDAPNGRCAKCGGPLLGDGGVEQDGEEVHAVCSVTAHGDPDMNPKSFQRRRRDREVLSYIRQNYGSVENAPKWILQRFER